MTTLEQTRTVQELLAKSDRQFAAGEYREGSEALWRAAELAMTAIAQKHGWEHSSYKELFYAAKRLSEEQNDGSFSNEFGVAEMFRENSIYGYLEDYEPDAFKSIVHRFVNRTLSLLEQSNPMK